MLPGGGAPGRFRAGKFVPPEKGGRYAEVHADATIAWPILVKAALEKLGASPAPPTGG